MKKRSTLVLAMAVVLIAALVSGCPKPTAEMKKAESAISEAKSAGAGQYAQNELKSAEQLLQEGKDLMKKFKYNEAKAKFEAAYQKASSARDIALNYKPPVQPNPVQPTPTQPTPPAKNNDNYSVVKGDCLWDISDKREIYSDPFQWPLIYWANQDQIDKTANQHGFARHEENWIFPGQSFDVPRDSSIDKVKDARKRAGAPAPYTPPGK